MTPRLMIAVLLTPAAFALGGCEAISHVTTSLLPTRPTPAAAEPMHYPDDAETAEPLDILVVRMDRRTIRFDNRTTRPLDEVTVYLNHEYGAVLETLPIGGSGPIALSRFVNHHAERYPIGSFLEPEKAKVLLLADAVVDGRVHKMNVRLIDEWDAP